MLGYHTCQLQWRVAGIFDCFNFLFIWNFIYVFNIEDKSDHMTDQFNKDSEVDTDIQPSDKNSNNLLEENTVNVKMELQNGKKNHAGLLFTPKLKI